MIQRIEVDLVLHMVFDTTTIVYGLFGKSSIVKGRFSHFRFAVHHIFINVEDRWSSGVIFLFL
ncbi:hypothetical protein Hanom_Chr09g00846451 [Helianthus anomalus]